MFLPMTLTSNTKLIQFKLFLCSLVFMLSVALMTLKVYILSVTDDSQQNSKEDWLEVKLGVKKERPFLTVLPDVSMILA